MCLLHGKTSRCLSYPDASASQAGPLAFRISRTFSPLCPLPSSRAILEHSGLIPAVDPCHGTAASSRHGALIRKTTRDSGTHLARRWHTRRSPAPGIPAGIARRLTRREPCAGIHTPPDALGIRASRPVGHMPRPPSAQAIYSGLSQDKRPINSPLMTH